jgi:CubicO group peptidase (beta-lactamase class C family)
MRIFMGYLLLIVCTVALMMAGCESGPDATGRELASIVDEYRGENDQFGVLFAKFDGHRSSVYTAGGIDSGNNLRLASVSKTYLSFIFLREGINIDDTIDTFFPTDRYPGSDKITARMLLNHTSGIPDDLEIILRPLGDDPDPDDAFRFLVRALSEEAEHPDVRIDQVYNYELGLSFPPGTMWCYSNTGYMMLGRMLERSTGVQIEDLFEKHYSRVAPSLYIDDGREVDFPDSYIQPWPIHWSQPWVAGGAISTAADAVKVLHYISKQPEFRLMREWATQQRCEREVVGGIDYGLGLQRFEFDGVGEGFGHDGMTIARSFLFTLSDTTYLIYVTRFVTNSDLMMIAHRLLEKHR